MRDTIPEVPTVSTWSKAAGMTRRGMNVAVAFVALGILNACAVPPPPPSAPTPTQRPVDPPVVSVTSAKLEIEQASATVSGPDRDGYFYYQLYFRLRETSGTEPAIIQNIAPSSPDGPDEGYTYGPTCFNRIVRVEANGTLDLFLTDTGRAMVGCWPVTWGRTPATAIKLGVSYGNSTSSVRHASASATVLR